MDGSSDSFVSRTMSAVQRIEHVHIIELRLVIPGLLGEPRKSPERLKVFEEPHQDPEEKPVVQPTDTVVKIAEDSRSLVELYEAFSDLVRLSP